MAFLSNSKRNRKNGITLNIGRHGKAKIDLGGRAGGHGDDQDLFAKLHMLQQRTFPAYFPVPVLINSNEVEGATATAASSARAVKARQEESDDCGNSNKNAKTETPPTSTMSTSVQVEKSEKSISEVTVASDAVSPSASASSSVRDEVITQDQGVQACGSITAQESEIKRIESDFQERKKLLFQTYQSFLIQFERTQKLYTDARDALLTSQEREIQVLRQEHARVLHEKQTQIMLSKSAQSSERERTQKRYMDIDSNYGPPAKKHRS